MESGGIMNAAIDTLTPAETAVVAGVSMRDVHRVIDEHILPESLYDIREARSFRSDGPGRPANSRSIS